MRALILLGGRGTRLRPLTENCHKSLVPVLNRPFLDRVLEWLGASDVHHVTFAIGQHNEDLAAAYPPGRYFGTRVDHSLEHERLESGGAIRHALEGIEERFLVLNGDIFTRLDLREFCREHSRRGAELSMSLVRVDDPRPFGIAELDDANLIVAFREKPDPCETPSRLANAGVWLFEPHLVREIPAGAVRVEETLFPDLVRERRNVLGVPSDAPWVDIGTPERYRELNLRLLDEGEGNVPDSRSHFDPSVSIEVDGVTWRSVLGPKCRVGHAASIRESIAWSRVQIGDGASVEDSVLCDDVVIERGATVRGAVLGAGVVVPGGATVGSGTVLEREDAALGK